MQIMKPLKSLVACILLAAGGCGASHEAEYSSTTSAQVDMAPSAAKRALRTEATLGNRVSAEAFATGAAGAASPGLAGVVALGPARATQPEATSTSAGPAISRKIIYDSQVDLVVESVDPIAKKVTSLVQAARGYIAEQNVTGSPGSLRSIHWRIRIPVEEFDSFTYAVVSLGELERNNRTSQDVSDQYYDIEARIKNKKVEEQTLNKILQERSGKLEDVLKIEVELSRVRGEIEQLEGKIRVLENLSSLATLTLNIREHEKYSPRAPVIAGFGTQVSRTWQSSMTSLVDLGKAIVLWIVSWAIWIPFILVGLILAWVLIRKLIRVFIRNLPRLVALARTPITPPRAPTQSG
jgi:Domain of unknown function (DUF4349)